MATTVLVVLGLQACESVPPADPLPDAIRIKLSPAQAHEAINTWADAVLRIDRELIHAEGSQDAKAIRMTRYRKAFAAEVLTRLRAGDYKLIVVDSASPPAPQPDLLSTYGHVFHGDTGQWAALVQVPRAQNPDLFELYEACKHDFLPPR